MSLVPDFDLSFLDRQRIKRTEDKILDREIIFDSLLDTLSKLRELWSRDCLCESPVDCTCSFLIMELEEQMSEVRLNMKRVQVLHKRVQSIAQIVCSSYLGFLY